jgi:eukaryotic-like serine/threonine-protein kinase
MKREDDATEALIGRRLRGFEILSLVGEGGMGVVYRARDATLGREVAVKLLPRELSADPARLARLDREARLLASLNHPGIATLHGLEEADGQRFLVMELVPGVTLAERLHRGPLPVAEALAVGRQMADALEAAHEKGVVHRDLKPANVKLTPDGRVKLLDFGLAKALEGAGSELATRSAEEATREGAIVGTPAYMSPEQARGEVVDRRTDVWGFGCCLFECLSARKAFAGNTASDRLAAVLDREPDWGALPAATPEVVRRLMRRCLTKDVRKRLQHIGDARLELEEAEAGPGERPRTAPARSRALLGLAGLAVLLVGLALGLGLWLGARRATLQVEPRVARLTLRVEGEGADSPGLTLHAFFIPLALSPDGARLVLLARVAKGQQLFLREISTFETKPIPGTEGAMSPFFSPDGRWVGFWRADDQTLWKVPLSGGPPVAIASTDALWTGLWGEDDEIVFDTVAGLWSVPAAGGQPREIVVRDRVEGESVDLRARVPGRRDLLVASVRPEEKTVLQILSRETGKRHRLLQGVGMLPARYAPTGHLVYASGGALFGVPVDHESLLPVGIAAPLIDGIDRNYDHSNVALSDTGTVAYVPAEHIREPELAWMDRGGTLTPVPGGRGDYSEVALSPDSRAAAIVVARRLWILDLEHGVKRLLTPDGSSRAPIFSPDGSSVTYVAQRGAGGVLCRRRADGTGAEERLTVRDSGWPEPTDWSPDGRSLLFNEYSSRGDSDIWIYSEGKASRFVATPFSELGARFSPDGRFVAFDSDEGGDDQVYVQPFPGPGEKKAISIESSRRPQWGPDGRQLFFQSGKGVSVVPVQTDHVFRSGSPQLLFRVDILRTGSMMTRDGRRLLVVSRRMQEGPTELRVVLNWFEELERLAPHPRR